MNAATRAQWLRSLASRRFDLLVIGGGITGAGVALDAASRGLSVALLEKADFASGTSSRSSKLIHGGLRYLRQGRLRVTLESARERELLRRLAPRLVRDIPFVFPVYRGSLQHAAVDTALWIYDAAAGRPRGRTHASLSPMRVRRRLPALRRDGLDGAELYFDARADDARLVMHVICRAADFGAVVLNYARVTRLLFEGGRVVGASGEDALGSGAFEVRARRTVAAVGVWAEEMAAMDDAPAPVRLRVGGEVSAGGAVPPPCPRSAHVPYDRRSVSGSSVFVLSPSGAPRRIVSANLAKLAGKFNTARQRASTCFEAVTSAPSPRIRSATSRTTDSAFA